MELISKYPEFEPMYSHLYDMCRNIEGVMNMFSKELQIMDHNTATYMIDELQEELDTTKERLDTTKEQLDTTKEQLDTTKEQLDTTKEQLDTTKKQLDIANSLNLKKDDTISSQAEEIIRLKQLLADKGVEA